MGSSIRVSVDGANSSWVSPSPDLLHTSCLLLRLLPDLGCDTIRVVPLQKCQSFMKQPLLTEPDDDSHTMPLSQVITFEKRLVFFHGRRICPKLCSQSLRYDRLVVVNALPLIREELWLLLLDALEHSLYLLFQLRGDFLQLSRIRELPFRIWVAGVALNDEVLFELFVLFKLCLGYCQFVRLSKM